MFEPIDGLPEGVVGLRAVGRVTGDDYRVTLVPSIEAATAEGRKVRLMLELGDRYEGYDPSAMAADAGLGIDHLRSFERIAVVTDIDWLRGAIHVFGPLIPGEVKLFAKADEADAKAWITA